jgi:hypothetical protein
MQSMHLGSQSTLLRQTEPLTQQPQIVNIALRRGQTGGIGLSIVAAIVSSH